MSIPPKNRPNPIPYLFAFSFGLIHALFLSFTKIGRFLAKKRTWLTVVIGVGGDLIIARHVMARNDWLRLVAVITASSLPIITRSLLHEHAETNGTIERIKRNSHA